MLKIDAHHHLWRYDPQELEWLQGALSPLRRDFTPADLKTELRSARVSGTVAVQARQAEHETRFLLDAASATPEMLGVIGWLPITSPRLSAMLETYADQPLLKGLRHIVQAELDGFMDAPSFSRGVAVLTETGLTYDILIYERQLAEATRLVDRHPNQIFVLDHIAKPRIVTAEMEPWAAHIRTLAERPNVVCKLSGMVTEADPLRWSPAQLHPYFDVVLEAFTPARLVAGSDWPVLLAGCGYAHWWTLIKEWIAPLSHDEQQDILARTAARTYHLSLSGMEERYQP